MLERLALAPASNKLAQWREFGFVKSVLELEIKFHARAAERVREQVLRIQSRILDPSFFEINGRRLQYVEHGHFKFFWQKQLYGTMRLFPNSTAAPEMRSCLFDSGSHDRRFFQPLGCDCNLQRLNQFAEIALHHAVQIIKRQTDAMIGYAVLRKIISANFLFAAAGANLAPPLRTIFFRFFALFSLQ